MRSLRQLLEGSQVPGVAELEAMCSSACRVSRLCELAGQPCAIDAGGTLTPGKRVGGAPGATSSCRPGSLATFPPFRAELELELEDLAVLEEDPDQRPYLWEL